jgi:hypothetical protein
MTEARLLWQVYTVPAGRDRVVTQTAGHGMKIECTACGYANEPNNRYCGRCSAVLSIILPDASQSPQQVLKSLSLKGGERKTLTVLFANTKLDFEGTLGLVQSSFGGQRSIQLSYGCVKG